MTSSGGGTSERNPVSFTSISVYNGKIHLSASKRFRERMCQIEGTVTVSFSFSSENRKATVFFLSGSGTIASKTGGRQKRTGA